jgi:hypothetical protein
MDTFDIIILTGRPAAGKSEVIDFLKNCPLEERIQRFHIGEFEEFDDFPYVWDTFEVDDILERHGRPRLWTDPRYYFTDEFIWNLFIEKINLALAKRLAENPRWLENHTAIVEFARGGENGIGTALSLVSPEVLARASIVYIKVSFEESARKNRRRFKPELAHSILYHSLPDEKMEFYYRTNDWETLSASSPTHIDVNGRAVPYSVFPNEPEVTHDPALLGTTLEKTMRALWELTRGR